MAKGWVSRSELEEQQAATRDWRERCEAAEWKLQESIRTTVGLQNQVASLERQADHLHSALERECHLHQRAQERLDNLMDKMIEMKREGFVPAPFAHTGELDKLDIDLDQQIIDAIEDRSQGIPALQRQLTQWALAAMREEGASVERVKKRILQGGSPPEEDEES